MVFSLSVSGSFKFLTPALLFLGTLDAERKSGEEEGTKHSDGGREGEGREKNKELCFCGTGCRQVPFFVRNREHTKRDLPSGPGAQMTEHR